MPLSPVEREFLLRVARCAVADAVLGEDSLASALATGRKTPALEERRAAFVTLKVLGDGGCPALRGCVGSMGFDDPLLDAVAAMAPKAALEDPRFPPLEPAELPRTRISISALTRPEPIDGPGQIVVGRDGVQLVHGAHHAVFLPQVAEEQGWGPGHLLERLALKAGLAASAWSDASLFRFRTESFGEPPGELTTGEA